ncbi:hypothetical protein Bca4012_070445 [Brassica carinata]
MISISFSFREVDVWRWSNRFGSMTTKPVPASRASFSQVCGVYVRGSSTCVGEVTHLCVQGERNQRDLTIFGF